MKYKENDYIRTKDGIIDKVIIDYNGHCNSPNCNCKHVSCKYNYYDEDTIIKSSPNIIDLIEVGDYVNGYRVLKVNIDKERNTWTIILDNETPRFLIANDVGLVEPIKSIVTKEQFKQIEFEVNQI